VGTIFDVERVADATEVRVFRGAVTVAEPGAPKRMLRAGEWWSLDPQAGATTGRFAPNNYPTWRNDWLQADNMPLKYAIARLNRYSAAKIDLADAAKADAPLTGRFDLRRTDATLAMISALLRLKVVRDDAGVHLKAAPNG
jgi:transmembrane sensor